MIQNDRTTESLLARRGLAEEATPGPWKSVYDYCVLPNIYDDRPANVLIADCSREHDHDKKTKANALYIAANDPSTVIADIDEILRLRAEVKFWRQETQDVRENFERTLQCERDKTDRLEREADWLALVLANAGCGIPLTEYIGEAVNGMSPPAPEHWREAARKAVETSHEN